MGIWSLSAAFDNKATAPVTTDGLVLNLDATDAASYAGTGTTWTNLVSGGANGTITGGAGYSSANGGQLTFDGSDDYIAVTLTKAASCTFSCWARTTTLAGDPMLFNAGPIGTGPDLFIAPSGGGIFWNTWDGYAAKFANIPANLTNGSFHNYVVVNNSVSGASLYYDGALLGSTTYKNAAANTTLVIGGAPTGYMWNGGIAVFMVHNKVLTFDEVTQNFNAHRSRYGI